MPRNEYKHIHNINRRNAQSANSTQLMHEAPEVSQLSMIVDGYGYWWTHIRNSLRVGSHLTRWQTGGTTRKLSSVYSASIHTSNTFDLHPKEKQVVEKPATIVRATKLDPTDISECALNFVFGRESYIHVYISQCAWIMQLYTCPRLLTIRIAQGSNEAIGLPEGQKLSQLRTPHTIAVAARE